MKQPIFYGLCLLLVAASGLFLTIRKDGPASEGTLDLKEASPGGIREPTMSKTENCSSATPSRASIDGQPALSPPDRKDLKVREAPPVAAALGAFNSKSEDEARMMLEVLNVYRRVLGMYPAGEDNRQFVNALLGANREKLPFLSSDHPRINAEGEIVDCWGTPFFFHLNSRTSVEVRSAGPDRHFFTGDDIVAGNAPEFPRRFEPDVRAPN